MISPGSITKIIKNPSAEQLKPHLLQVTQIYPPSTLRRGVKLSDGIDSIRAVLSTSTPVKNFDVIRVTHHQYVEIKGAGILLVNDFSIAYTSLDSLIGTSMKSQAIEEIKDSPKNRVLSNDNNGEEDKIMLEEDKIMVEDNNTSKNFTSLYNSYVLLLSHYLGIEGLDERDGGDTSKRVE